MRMPYMLLLLAMLLFPFILQSQDSTTHCTKQDRGIAGYHVGVVQPTWANENGDVHYIDESAFYAIGFPMGITFHTSGKLLFDMEFVPFVKPHANTDLPYEVHLLFHPGVLLPLKHGFTLGLRGAFEAGNGQFGFTPLINKAFSIGTHSAIFLELVAPARFGPKKDSGYTQVAGLHAGFGF